MPFACEDCGEMGSRMNTLFEIRLCKLCSSSHKYKLICKSKVLEKFMLTQSDLYNYPNIPKEFMVINPHYRSGPPMTLYKEIEIEKVFLSKYNELIIKLSIPELNLEEKILIVKDYYREQKDFKKKEKYYKILDKYNIGSEQELPNWIQDKINDIKSCAEYERVIISYIKFTKLYKLMKQEKLIKYIDHLICHNFIYQKDKTIKLEQIPSIIRFMLNKKKLVKQAVKTYKINTSKYLSVISCYINSFDSEPQTKSISNDFDTLIEYINRKEDNDK